MTDIVDAHHHIWRQANLPWLTGPMQPRIFGPYEPIRRDYPIPEYLNDLAGNGVVKSVYVQTNWAKERFEDETAWVQRTSEETAIAQDPRCIPHRLVERREDVGLLEESDGLCSHAGRQQRDQRAGDGEQIAGRNRD